MMRMGRSRDADPERAGTPLAASIRVRLESMAAAAQRSR